MIKIDNISLRYKDFQALDKVTLDFNESKFSCLIGLSGAGKTSLLRILNLLVKPTSGNLITKEYGVLNNKKNISEYRKQTAMIFQNNNLIPRFNILDNILLGRIYKFKTFESLFSFPKPEKIKAMECLEKVGLLNKSQKKITEISGGEKQRVCIARALYQKPRLILADEPISQLDPKNTNKVLELFDALTKENNTKIIMSLHQPKIGLEFCDKIIGLKKGKVLFKYSGKNLTQKKFNDLYIQ